MQRNDRHSKQNPILGYISIWWNIRMINAKLTAVTGKQIQCNYYFSKQLCITIHSHQGKVLGTSSQTQNCNWTPLTFNCFHSTILIEYLTTNIYPDLADTLSGRKAWAGTNNSKDALRLNWAEWEIKVLAVTQKCVNTRAPHKRSVPRLWAQIAAKSAQIALKRKKTPFLTRFGGFNPFFGQNFNFIVKT